MLTYSRIPIGEVRCVACGKANAEHHLNFHALPSCPAIYAPHGEVRVSLCDEHVDMMVLELAKVAEEIAMGVERINGHYALNSYKDHCALCDLSRTFWEGEPCPGIPRID